jgi:hypothetical protein
VLVCFLTRIYYCTYREGGARVPLVFRRWPSPRTIADESRDVHRPQPCRHLSRYPLFASGASHQCRPRVPATCEKSFRLCSLPLPPPRFRISLREDDRSSKSDLVEKSKKSIKRRRNERSIGGMSGQIAPSGSSWVVLGRVFHS